MYVIFKRDIVAVPYERRRLNFLILYKTKPFSRQTFISII